MKIILTGSLGNISKPLATALVQQAHAVTVISSKLEKRAEIEALGATAAIGSVEDAGFLTATFTGADAAYLMVPPNFAVADSRAYHQQVGHNYAQALRQAGVRRVVQLSSWGAHLSKGTGGILGTHDVEGILRQVPGIALTHLRPTSFFTNFYTSAGMIKGAGIMGANYAGDIKVSFVHPRDIATAAADELVKPTDGPGQAVRYVASDERTADEVAHAIGAAIGKPDLKWVAFTDAQMRENMTSHGVPVIRANEVVDIYASINSGKLGEDYWQHRPVLGEVKLEDFAREFAAAF
ncbi:NmrA family NAD(P)-binding protein [Microvirga sp. STS02]|uniref:NAD(P)H-binding protein n=1 Tax=Hymenobacter negativus TaxID=2795026 RepID=UPI0018DE2ADB|nr:MULTISPECIES: NmrA family NAD(P)-binding protein [Bacteria]MBH8571126.1 NmrA family NAD(P)-binding protein [Hymenobacter negativus]MBR7210863.1 NmrA family NAD(P)-binding protein [Microvirga sp. STS02]